MSERTIAAIATPLGEGSLGVIRISGENALSVADKVFRSFSGKKLVGLLGYSAAYGEIVDGERVIDDGVALVFKAPKSYTGEDVVEISIHGGRLILKEALRLILQNGGYRR
jgi:tRNA modification GTPase